MRLAKLQDHLRPWHPIRAFPVDQMADYIERAPSLFAFIPKRPSLRQIAQKRIESSGGAGEK